MALDEIGNFAPLPSLPTLMAEGGGTAITTMPCFSRWLRRERMGRQRRWGVLGGASNSRDLQDLSTLIGVRDERTDSASTPTAAVPTNAPSAASPAPDTPRTLPFGTGVIPLRTARPIVTDQRPWTDRPDARTLRGHRSGVAGLLRASSW